jgi:hypothetical protein
VCEDEAKLFVVFNSSCKHLLFYGVHLPTVVVVAVLSKPTVFFNCQKLAFAKLSSTRIASN